jgi:hypothetical protein
MADAKTAKTPRAARRVEEAATATGDGAGRPVCTVAFCPICLAVTATQGAAPDAMEHLLNAAREFLLAARAVIDSRADDVQRSKERTSRRFERIDIA